MAWQSEALFDRDLDLPEPADVEQLLLGDEAELHPEDALLAHYARWLRGQGEPACERRTGIELAREAIELLGGADGPWQALPVERWLRALMDGPAAADPAAAVRAARGFVSWLGASGRIGLHGQRVLSAKLAALRPSPGAGGAAREPRLAA